MAQLPSTTSLSGTASPPSPENATRSSLPVDHFAVDPESELPVGAQLLWQLRSLIRSGRILRGERLPSVRALADRCGVNVNTVRAAYRRLEEEKLVESRHGAGTFVSAAAPVSPALGELVASAIERARDAGVEPRDLAIALHSATPAPLPDVGREGDQRGARRELRRQIARLEAELASYPRELQPPPAPDERPHHGGRIAGVGELEATRDALMSRVAQVREAAARRDRTRTKARGRVEEMVRDPEGHKWHWVSSEDTGDRGCKEWRVTPRFGPVGAAMGWWRVKVSGGCPLAAPLAAASGRGG